MERTCGVEWFIVIADVYCMRARKSILSFSGSLLKAVSFLLISGGSLRNSCIKYFNVTSDLRKIVKYIEYYVPSSFFITLDVFELSLLGDSRFRVAYLPSFFSVSNALSSSSLIGPFAT